MKLFSKILNYTHRYLGLIIFLQVILWSFSGFIMYYLDFSDLYNIPPDKPISLTLEIPNIADINNIIEKEFDELKVLSISIKGIAGKTYYDIKSEKQEFLIGQERKIIEKLPEEIVKKISEEKYTGTGKIYKTEFLEKSEGNYYSSKPIYKVSFDDKQKSEIYINPVNGDILAKRKALWSFYNTMWEFHLMKYTQNQKLNKILLLISAITSLFVSVTGFIKFWSNPKVL